MSAMKSDGVRKPVVAGRFYPAARQPLTKLVDRYLYDCNQADATGDTDRLRAVIAPHAGYVCSGIVAAAAYCCMRSLPDAQYTVYLMGPAHWHPVHGVGLSSAHTFRTPLGDVPVASEQVGTLVDKHTQYHYADGAHAPEHCLEVQLPFLQATLPDFRIVPMLCDDEADAQQLADDLMLILADDPYSLIVVSSDLSHYLPYEQARSLDTTLISAVVSGDRVMAAQGQACGLTPILALMEIAQRLRWRVRLADYRNSGDTCGSHDQVVGYGAVVFYEAVS